MWEVRVAGPVASAPCAIAVQARLIERGGSAWSSAAQRHRAPFLGANPKDRRVGGLPVTVPLLRIPRAAAMTCRSIST